MICGSIVLNGIGGHHTLWNAWQKVIRTRRRGHLGDCDCPLGAPCPFHCNLLCCVLVSCRVFLLVVLVMEIVPVIEFGLISCGSRLWVVLLRLAMRDLLLIGLIDLVWLLEAWGIQNYLLGGVGQRFGDRDILALLWQMMILTEFVDLTTSAVWAYLLRKSYNHILIIPSLAFIFDKIRSSLSLHLLLFIFCLNIYLFLILLVAFQVLLKRCKNLLMIFINNLLLLWWRLSDNIFQVVMGSGRILQTLTWFLIATSRVIKQGHVSFIIFLCDNIIFLLRSLLKTPNDMTCFWIAIIVIFDS